MCGFFRRAAGGNFAHNLRRIPSRYKPPIRKRGSRSQERAAPDSNQKPLPWTPKGKWQTVASYNVAGGKSKLTESRSPPFLLKPQELRL